MIKYLSVYSYIILNKAENMISRGEHKNIICL